MTTKRDYYEILGVKKNSSLDEIKKSYRELALKYHRTESRMSKRKKPKNDLKKFQRRMRFYPTLKNAGYMTNTAIPALTRNTPKRISSRARILAVFLRG